MQNQWRIYICCQFQQLYVAQFGQRKFFKAAFGFYYYKIWETANKCSILQNSICKIFKHLVTENKSNLLTSTFTFIFKVAEKISKLKMLQINFQHSLQSNHNNQQTHLIKSSVNEAYQEKKKLVSHILVAQYSQSKECMNVKYKVFQKHLKISPQL
ncbi:unnamed protein product (macronuclear) [Paramecium tetraurelia]|uniref:Transmembrane protein n=1 Tax=Paramecium tetraurelia TaxID=5888 RepID=A0BT91_PARTE|nr:uncharacterized protein GSPATT00031990001 [Paramecium tetraurelia]CAK61758.1 unnamed protein product [Paramecium tetraurelia]|eukprot:XP_001429156.1 hypothetical protein (macronuclear) [Paramecium tetraurelia strain d4-2]